MRSLIPSLMLLCSPPIATLAHDIPNARVDRSIQAILSPGRLTIDYEVSLSELTLTQDLRSLIGVVPGVEPHDWYVSYGRQVGPLNARGFLVTLDPEALELRFLDFELDVEAHP